MVSKAVTMHSGKSQKTPILTEGNLSAYKIRTLGEWCLLGRLAQGLMDTTTVPSFPVQPCSVLLPVWLSAVHKVSTRLS